MIEAAGWLGSIMLGLCAVPAFYKVWKEGHARGLSTLSVALWFSGEVFTIVYLLFGMKQVSLPLLANYVTNVVLVGGIIYYKIYPRSVA